MIELTMTGRRVYLPLMLITLVLLSLPWLRSEDGVSEFGGGVGTSSMKGIEVIHYSGSGPEWRAEIREALFTEGETTPRLRDVSIYYPGRKISLHAEEGLYNMDNGKIRLEGVVRGKGEGFSFESPELDYNPADDTITTSKGVVIKGESYLISGRQGKITGSRLIELTGNVRTLFF